MSLLITITSKNQITIPAEVVELLGLKKGQKLIAERRGSSLVLTPTDKLIEEIGGSFAHKVPKHLKGINIDEAIEQAKMKYFSEKYAKTLR